MIRSCVALVLLSVTANASDAITLSDLETAKTTAEIVAAAENGVLKDDDGTAYFSSAEYRSPWQKAFVVWYNPYSGRAACHVYIYVHDGKRGLWVRKVERVFDGTHSVSVELGDAITIRDVKGKEIHRYSTK